MVLRKIRWWFNDHIRRPLVRLFNRIKYHYHGGYKCDGDGCIVKLPIKWTVIETVSHGKRMILSNNTDRLYCKHCLAFKFQDYFQDAHLYEGEDSYFEKTKSLVNGKCYWTEKERIVVGGIFKFENPLAERLDLDVRFGDRWWNGHLASQEALVDGMLHHKLQYRTSVIGYRNGKNVYVDQNGIEISHEIDFCATIAT